MIDNPEQVLKEFKEEFLNLSIYVQLPKKLLTHLRNVYYRACLVDTRCKKAKDTLLKSRNKKQFVENINHIIQTYEKDVDKRYKQSLKTLTSLIQHHLNNFSGQNPSDYFLSRIEHSLNEIIIGMLPSTNIRAEVDNNSFNSEKITVHIKEI